MNAATLWNPERMDWARDDGQDLADLLNRRTELHNTSGFSASTQYHVCDLVKAASADNCLFGFYSKESLSALWRMVSTGSRARPRILV